MIRDTIEWEEKRIKQIARDNPNLQVSLVKESRRISRGVPVVLIAGIHTWEILVEYI